MNGSWEDEDEDADPPVDPNEPPNVTVSPGCDADTRTHHEEYSGTRMCNHTNMDVATELVKVKPRKLIAIIT